MNFTRPLRAVTVTVALTVGLLGAGTIGPASATSAPYGSAALVPATQASGDDVPAWSNGWSWTYGTTFTYAGSDANATVKESVTYTNAGRTTFQGQDAYKLDISGRITGGSGHANAAGGVDLDSFSGTVSGTRYVRASDLALLQEKQHQHLDAKAHKVVAISVTANIDLTLTPSPGWRTHDFPLNAGDSWKNDESVSYTGGFDYDSSLASGSSPFNGSFPFKATSHVSSQGSDKLISASASTDDGTVTDDITYSPTYRNDSKEHMVLPLSGAKLTIDRTLTSAHVPAPSKTLSATITPSFSCAGGEVTVSGKVGNTNGTAVSVVLDQSQVDPGRTITRHTATGANGSYSTTLPAPAEPDGLDKSGSRANWGVLVSGGGAANAATLVVSPEDCTTLSYTGETSAPRGTDATVSAKLVDLAGASVAGRTVRFAISGGGTASATTDSAGVATTTLPVGDTARDATVSASFAGTSTMTAASDSAAFSVGVVGTTTSVSPSQPTVGEDDPITFTARVSSDLAGAGTPDGAVQFVVDGSDFGAPVALSDGSATSAAISTLAQGDHTVQAVYGGSSGFGTSTSTKVTFEVTPPRQGSTTTLSANPDSAVFGQDVTLRATVTGASSTPTGSVSFASGTETLGTVPLDADGDASLTTGDLPVGSTPVVATYSGDRTYESSSSSPRTVAVAKADTKIVLTGPDDTTVSGEPVGLGVAVQPLAPGAGTPTGTVQLVVDGTPVGSPVELAGGSAALPTLTSLRAGDHTLAAEYSGDASFRTSSSSVTQRVVPAGTTTTLTASPSPSNQDQPVTLTAAVVAVAPGSGEPTGTVTFTSDGDTIGAAPLTVGEDGARAVIQVSTLAPGSHSIVASYAGDSSYDASNSNEVSQTVIEGSAVVGTHTTLTSTLNPSTYGQLVSFRARVTADDDSSPTGAVQFSMDGTNFGAPVAVTPAGVAMSPVIASPDPGDHTVIAQFLPEAGYSGSGDSITQTVADADVAVTLTSSDPASHYGQAVSFKATVGSLQAGTGTPTGVVQFRIDGRLVGDAVPLDGGMAVSQPISDLPPGDHTVSALYSGDVHFAAKAQSITQQVATVRTTTRLTASSTSTTYGDPVTLTATVTPETAELGMPDGAVTFRDGGNTLATVPLRSGDGHGTAAVTLADLDAGTHSITVVYSGSASFGVSASSPATVSVAKRATRIHADAAVVSLIPLGLPLGELHVTLQAAGGAPLAGAPVQFTVGRTVVCTVTTDATGSAICNARSHLLGLVLFNGYTATYSGDPNHLPSSARGGILK